MAAAATLRP
ncbi:hypothetical protein RB213_013559 [Colletotrichum asianum]